MGVKRSTSLIARDYGAMMLVLPDPTAPLAVDEANEAFATLLDGKASEDEIQNFLTALSDRGETAVEIAAAASAMRERMIPISAPSGAIDVCGTGGDGHHTLNVSTAVSLVVAACDVPVAKHGNRAASSRAGAADTLEALGLNLGLAAEHAERSLTDIGICFLFAQDHHPALKRLGPIRKAIGRRTIFNLMGPLANPARVERQLIGIARPAYVPIYAEALATLGTARAMVVSGDEGLDELSVAGGNDVAEIVQGGVVAMRRWTPHDAGLPAHPIAAIRGGDAAHNAGALRALLLGELGAYRDAVLFNAGAALVIAGLVHDLREGVDEAAEVIDKGLANALLNCWIAYR
jgi:anthranilate phosphoribosyltransferase